MEKKYDVIIIGGGTAGCSCAYNSAKLGLKTLLIEKNIHLGGTITSGLVVPAMKAGENLINTDFFNALILELKKMGGQVTFLNNPGWFNPELTKIALDNLLASVGVNILFNTEVLDAKITNNRISAVSIKRNILSEYNVEIYPDNNLNRQEMLLEYIETNYVVDATGNCNFSKLINCDFLKNNEDFQPISLRFVMSNVNIDILKEFLVSIDADRNITPIESIDRQIHLSTAYTWDTDKHWALADIFKQAIHNGCLKESDSNYFQIFTIPGAPGSIAFNSPRIVTKVNPNSAEELSVALIEARAAIYRLSRFCKKYIPGFEKAYISNIADLVGIRESNRIKGKYVYTIEDLRSGKRFNNPAVISSYPVDVHSTDRNTSKLEFNGEYQLPIESLMSYNYENLYVAGRSVSADKLSQGALRIQPSCFAMGEAVAKHIKSRINLCS